MALATRNTKIAPPLVLASASPRRAGLLRDLGLDFRIMPSGYEEKHDGRPGDPAHLVETLALGKARDVAARLENGLILGADTIVILDGATLEKPVDTSEAAAMLASLSGRWHEVFTGLALVEIGGRTAVAHERTEVKFRTLAPAEIEAYVETGEPMDKAGAYGIQGLGAILIERIDGCYTNVVGLPLPRLACMLRGFGVEVLRSEK